LVIPQLGAQVSEGYQCRGGPGGRRGKNDRLPLCGRCKRKRQQVKKAEKKKRAKKEERKAGQVDTANCENQRWGRLVGSLRGVINGEGSWQKGGQARKKPVQGGGGGDRKRKNERGLWDGKQKAVYVVGAASASRWGGGEDTGDTP